MAVITRSVELDLTEVRTLDDLHRLTDTVEPSVDAVNARVIFVNKPTHLGGGEDPFRRASYGQVILRVEWEVEEARV